MKRRPHHGNQKNRNYNDFFGMDSDDDDNDDFFGIDEDFDDPFEDMMMDRAFGFPSIEQIHNRLFGKIGRSFDMLGDGDYEENQRKRKNKKDERRLQKKGGMNDFHEFMSIQGMGPGTGTVISKSYCSKIDYRDGQPHQECYQSQSINQIKDGHKISEKQEAYKNSRTGVQKAAHQRILDDKGTKQIRQRNVNTGVQEEHNIFKGMREDELDNFNETYNDYRNKVGFQNNYKYLNALNKKGRKQYLDSENQRRNNQNNTQYPQLGDGSNKNRINIRKPYRKNYGK